MPPSMYVDLTPLLNSAAALSTLCSFENSISEQYMYQVTIWVVFLIFDHWENFQM